MLDEKENWACPICGPLPVNCPCTAAEQDMYLEIERLRLTDEERSVIQACAELTEKSGVNKAAATLRALLERTK